ncbi:MAG: DNA-directed RNA polymerase subunit beta' [Planctomycetia bacterium]|nr:DNA-directed RNA polymerase subunit beta' [Planctomycetia bacterium]
MPSENVYEQVNEYGSVRISLASPNEIRSWSFGEVRKPETINYRTYRPERDGLFCERIFGPERNWECSCGKYKGIKHKGMICDRCGVKVTHSRVRRKRMGHINLAAPVVHIWFFKAMPSRLACLLDMKTSDLEKVVYYQDYLVIDPGSTPLKEKQLLTEDEYRSALEQYGSEFEVDMGADAVKKMLGRIDLEVLSHELRLELQKTRSKQKLRTLAKRLKVVENLRNSGNKPEWLVLEVVPVIPPDLRPLVLLDSGNFATSDLNDLYRRIMNRNNRLKKLVDLNAPEIIIRNEKRMLQQAVDALFDNGRCRRPVLGSSNRPLKSLTDMIKGKQGRFRENLLGKRVDYSARSVIVVGPELKLHQCGLPKKIALELYQPFIIRRLKELGYADTIKSAKRMLERKEREVWDILEEVTHQHAVLLNRAPTLHRMGIQAFEPVLVEGNAIKIHPLVCKGFNADFDGDQMAVHLPLSLEAQVEATVLMMSTNNIFSPSNGEPIMSPSQDVVLGTHFITVALDGENGEGMIFASTQEALAAHAYDKVTMHANVKVRLPEDKTEVVREGPSRMPDKGIIDTTVGRVIFNDILPMELPYYNFVLDADGLVRVISDCYRILGRGPTIDLLDNIKDLGFKHATLAGLSFSITDIRIPVEKKRQILEESQKQVDRMWKNYRAGVITDAERYNQVIDVWTHAREEITKEMMNELKNDTRDGRPYLNPLYMMVTSGARGGVDQVRQLAGMRGLMARPSGKIIETPIKANFREGLSMLDYFSSTHGARKGLADTALKTADSGYLTRKLVDVAQSVIIVQQDCGTVNSIEKEVWYLGAEVERPLPEAIFGRVAAQNIVNPLTDEYIVKEGEMITVDIADQIAALGIERLRVRSPLTCDSPVGLCAKCYGMDLSTGITVEEGMAVGIIAAQSIGEPGTQLTMRTFHIGGTASRTVLEREHRASHSGTVDLRNMTVVDVTSKAGDKTSVSLKRNGEVAVLDDKGREIETFTVPLGANVAVKQGQRVKPRKLLASWDPHMAPILSEVGGIVHYEDLVDGETLRLEEDRTGMKRKQVIEHKGDLHPRIIIADSKDKILDFQYIPANTYIEVNEGDRITAGTVIGRRPRDIGGTQDITGGLLRVTELFEARKPKEPAIMSEIDGVVELSEEKKRGKMTIVVRNTQTDVEHEHYVPHGRHLRAVTGDSVTAGDQLTDGPLVPHDILRVVGEAELHDYMLREIQNVYRSQGVKINDKHVEIILSQMLRRVRVDNAGDTDFLPGEIVDKFAFLKTNLELSQMLKVVEPGDTEFADGQLVLKNEFEEAASIAEQGGGTAPKGKRPRHATAQPILLGVTKASLHSDSFISAASFQETTKVLTEASLSGAVDKLTGLKENVIMGHLIPAGTAFKPYKDSIVRLHAEPAVLAAPAALAALGLSSEEPAQAKPAVTDEETG